MQESVFETFLANIRASGLIDSDYLNENAHHFMRVSDPNQDEAARLTAFKEFLIGNKILTSWQLEKLAKGKWKGFYLDDYVLCDLLEKGKTPNSNLYAARDRHTGELAKLEVFVDKSSTRGIRYEVK
jgi:hypothetical protein